MHNSKPPVSVIMPAYNSAKYIAEAIDSVLAQTYPMLEIIVVDDGSTDSTGEIVKKYVEKQRNKETKRQIRYIYQENKGPAAARNNGIRAAKGGYIAFLDSDDIWLTEKIELQMAKFGEDDSYSMIHTGRIRIGLDGAVQPAKAYEVQDGFIFEKLLMTNFICTSTSLVKKTCFDEVGLFDEDSNICEDYDMWLRISVNHKIGLIKQPLIKYRINQNGHCRSNIKVSSLRERTAFLKSIASYQGDRENLKKEKFYGLAMRTGDSFFYNKSYKEASSAYLEAARLNKFDIKSSWRHFLSTCIAILNIQRKAECQ
jgi:glycosyltransferase involved in cell wall biosynthesis